MDKLFWLALLAIVVIGILLLVPMCDWKGEGNAVTDATDSVTEPVNEFFEDADDALGEAVKPIADAIEDVVEN